MAYDFTGLDFTVRIEGRFAGAVEWLVRARVQYRADVGLDRSHRALADARSALVTGILLEAREGYRMGARSVRARIEGDPVVAGTFAMSPPAPLRTRVA